MASDPALIADYVAPRTLTVGSLFSGIGGIDLGLERAGMTVIWQSEIEPYASKVLAKHWPSIPNLGDIKQIDWSHVERPDVVAGGFPCQPISSAGPQKGQTDSRWLWPEFARCLRELRPRYAILENVPALLTLAGGRAAQEVFGDLALLGYDAEWGRVSAAGFGAPHIRKRIFVVAHAHGDELRVQQGWSGQQRSQGTLSEGEVPPLPAAHGASRPVADTDSQPLFGPPVSRPERHPWTLEPDVGRVADGIPSRVDRLRCLGNAVVPQVAEYVGRRLAELIDGQEASDER